MRPGRDATSMTNGLGTGFFAFAVLAVLAALAVVVAVAGGVGLLVGDARGRVDPLFRAVAVAVLAVALAVAAFGVAATLDESPPIAALLAGLTAAPVAVAAARARGVAAPAGWTGVAAAAALAWPLPFLAALVVLWALTVATGLPAAATGVVAVAVAAGGAAVATDRAAALVAPATAP